MNYFVPALFLLPTGLLLLGSWFLFRHRRTLASVLLLIGAAFQLLSAVTRVLLAEPFHVPSGVAPTAPQQLLHYLIVSASTVGHICFPLGFFLYVLGCIRSGRSGGARSE